MKKGLTLVVALLCAVSLMANNIVVNNVSIASQNNTEKYKMIKLDLAWSNSWRTYNYESNYDAAWVFVKYRRVGTTVWNHATFNYLNGLSDGHIKPVNGDINTPADGKGVFVFRANTSPTNFMGDVSYKDLQLRWNYGADGLGDAENIEIAVFTIEMVYVPQMAFYVGDGNDAGQDKTFRDGDTAKPFYITSEAQVNLGGTVLGNMSIRQTSVTGLNDDFSLGVTKALPAAFPKGYKAFYCMKYETSQEQYAEFLKKLTPVQVSSRFPNKYGSHRHTINLNYQADAPDRACNYLDWWDGTAYADWAGLRPMTELEFEKASRGTIYPVPYEYAWGNANIIQLTSLAQDGTAFETDNAAVRANAHYHHGINFQTTDPLYGPVRSGWTVGGSREQSGDTYYGISDMTGNLEEFAISVGSVLHRSFIGSHGDGNLSTDGFANNADWPGSSTRTQLSVLTRGGSIFGSGVAGKNSRLPVSNRFNMVSLTYNNDSRMPFFGFRGVRTAN